VVEEGFTNVTAARPEARGDTTRDLIKARARELIATRGVANVSIRDIATAVGQKNGGSINYHFRSKDELIGEILNDIAEEADRIGGELLDQLEGRPRPIVLRDILKLLIAPRSPEAGEITRLFVMLQLHQGDLMSTTISRRFSMMFERCVRHLIRLLPDTPEPLLRQRLFFLMPYAWMFLASRTNIAAKDGFWKQLASGSTGLNNFLDSAEGILRQPPSAETIAGMAEDDAGR
jgi:AcrR family transcriptional regulator